MNLNNYEIYSFKCLYEYILKNFLNYYIKINNLNAVLVLILSPFSVHSLSYATKFQELMYWAFEEKPSHSNIFTFVLFSVHFIQLFWIVLANVGIEIEALIF